MKLTPRSVSTGATSSPVQCCFPVSRMFGRKRRPKRTVRFATADADRVSGLTSTPLLKSRLSRRRSRRSPGRSSYYSAVSHMDEALEELIAMADCSDDEETVSGKTEGCICEHPAHSTFDPQFPLVAHPKCCGDYEELLIHAQGVLGRWVTIMDRSDSLDPQMVHVGIGKMKRMVINRLAIPLGAELIEDKKVLKVWIETPVGNKYTHASLVGDELFDKDSDLGDWSSQTSMVDYSTPVYCGGTPVRAMQLKRLNPKLGVAFETRCVLPDAQYGAVLLYNITIKPPNDGNIINVNRIYKRA